MFKNYLKTAWRTISRNKIYSGINITGLTIGLCACMMVATIVVDDLSYDRQWGRTNDIYRIVTVNKMGEGLYDRFASSFTGVGNVLRNDFPEVETVADISVWDKNRFRLSAADETGVNPVTLTVDTTAWQMLDFKVLSGSPRKYVEGTTNMMITKSFQKNYFAKEDPVGRVIEDIPDFSDKPRKYLITGVIDDLPSNTVFRADVVILSIPRLEEASSKQAGTFSRNFILMKPGVDMKKFTAKVNDWYAHFVQVKNPYQYEFQPMKDIYLHSEFAENLAVKGSLKNIFILSGVALLLLIIACVNFINLTTARALRRMKETGIRKILGAKRKQLMVQFVMESVLFFVMATMLALVLYQLSLPAVEGYLGHKLSLTVFSSLALAIKAILLIVAISILIGLYPALLLSGFRPALAVKGGLFNTGHSGQNIVRKALVVFQFAISIIVLVALIVVKQQVSFFTQKDLGFNKDHLLYTEFIHLGEKAAVMKNEMLRKPGVESVSLTPWTPGSKGYMTRDVELPGRTDEKVKVWYITGDVDMAKTMGLQLTKGRYLDRSFGFDAMNDDDLQMLDSATYSQTASLQSSLITAYTARLLNIQQLGQPRQSIRNTPVGIVKDFVPESLKSEMSPTVVLAQKNILYGGMMVRVTPGKEKEVAAIAHQLLKKYYPEKAPRIYWVDDMLMKQYIPEEKLMKLFGFFSSLSMLLAALGIFGLIVQATAERVKEIGIRKVLGASAASVVKLFSLDFLKLILISLAIATPVAWWLMNKWLMDYAYKIRIHWWVFALAGLVAIVIALLTISFQAIKAAKANPVKSLRSE